MNRRSDNSKSADNDEYSIVRLCCFLVVVALFVFVSTEAGIRGAGVYMTVGALSQLRKGRIAYGLDGRPASGYITGAPAKVFILFFAALGMAVLIWPEVVMGVLGWD